MLGIETVPARLRKENVNAFRRLEKIMAKARGAPAVVIARHSGATPATR
jgi:hypothetical protein